MTGLYPFRVDTVGSYLRSPELLEARKKVQASELSKEQLSHLEDEEIKKLVEDQIAHGLKIVTDGELRRYDFYSSFPSSFLGIKLNAPLDENETKLTLPIPLIVDKIAANPDHPELRWFDFLKSITPEGITPKILVPSPNTFFMGIQPGSPLPAPYKTIEEIEADVIKAFHDTLILFYQHGCRYAQIDEAGILTGPAAAFADDEVKQHQMFSHLYGLGRRLFPKIVDGLPADFRILLHMCRGNNKFFTLKKNKPKAGYKDCIELMTETNPSAYLLEYDDERSGSFEPLKQIHETLPNAVILLGVVTTKSGELESDEVIEGRIHEAAKYVPLNRLGICNQCGFSTLKDGNFINVEQQWAKVDLLVRVGKKIWGSA